MIIPKLVIISLGKQARLGCVIPCAPHWLLGLHKRGWGLEERPGYRRLLPLKEQPAPPPTISLLDPAARHRPCLIKWYFPHTKAASDLIFSTPTPPSFFPAREYNERGPCLNPKVGYHRNLIIHADQSLFNANQDNRSAL